MSAIDILIEGERIIAKHGYAAAERIMERARQRLLSGPQGPALDVLRDEVAAYEWHIDMARQHGYNRADAMAATADLLVASGLDPAHARDAAEAGTA